MTTLGKKMKKRDLILTTSLNLFAEKGFHATPVSLIADTANIGTGTIYRYFKSKDILINELYYEVKSSFANEFITDFPPDISVKENFLKLWENLTYYYLNNAPESIFLDLCTNTPVISDETKKDVDKSFSPLRFFVEQAINKEIIVQVQPEIIWSFISGPIQTMVKMSRNGRIKITPEIIRNAFDFFWRGVRD